MDQVKTGELIRQLRSAAGLTQRELAERLSVSDKAVSKWECGNGSPDISLLSELAEVFGTDVQTLLAGELNRNEKEKGDMKRLNFYVCENCGNIITATSEASVTCCGSRLLPLEPEKAEEADMLKVEDMGGELFVTAGHEMKKEHYISFAAYVSDSSAMVFRQYPEWDMQVRLPLYRPGKLVWYCTKHGLFYQELRPRRK